MAGIQDKWQTASQQKDMNSTINPTTSSLGDLTKINNPHNMDIYDIVDKAYQAGEEFVDAATIQQRYAEGEKCAFAKLKNAARTLPLPTGKKAWTQGEIEDTAYAHPDWEKYLNEWNAAYEAMLRAKNNHDAWKNKFEAARSKMATDRFMHKVM
jgi:hypothetical protein